jgi:hypothetical protein
LSAFFVIDPFLVANSFIINENILSIFFSGLLLVCYKKDRPLLKLSLIIAILASGYGCGYLIITTFILLIIQWVRGRNPVKNAIASRRLEIQRLFTAIKENWWILFIFMTIFLLQPIEYSSILSGINKFINQWNSPFAIENSPHLFLVGIISYYPLVLIPLLFLNFSDTRKMIKGNINLSMALFLTFIIIAFFPGHLIIDIVWVSVPLCILLAKVLSENSLSLKKEDHILFLLFIFGLASIIISLINLSNSIFIGSFRLENFLIVVFLGISLGMGALIASLFFPNAELMKILRTSFFLVLFVFQIIILNRIIGINHKPDEELIWNGYPTDLELTQQIIKEYSTSNKTNGKKFEIYIEEGIHPSMIWELVEDGYSLKNMMIKLKTNDVFISRTEFLPKSASDFITQKYIVNAYPAWSKQPLKSIFSTDFWKWLLWRDSDLYKEYNFLNIRTKFLNEHVMEE